VRQNLRNKLRLPFLKGWEQRLAFRIKKKEKKKHIVSAEGVVRPRGLLRPDKNRMAKKENLSKKEGNRAEG